MEHRTASSGGAFQRSKNLRSGSWVVLVAASLVFLVNIVSPPRLMDDVDSVQAQIARTMLQSGDWVTARLDGIAYLEKAPLVYWTMAASYRVFGVHDWAARLPLAMAVVLLCWVTFRFGCWAFGDETGVYSGLALSTCIGLWLFTRILIPDAMVTLTITVSIWAWLRLLEPDEKHPRRWASIMGVCFGLGLLLKGLIAAVFPLLAAIVYMGLTRQAFSWNAWKKLHLWLVALVAIAIAGPWHILATLRNPPYFAFSMHSGPGEYRGFFWFYFFNEHVLRFLNMRYPRDYNTVPRIWFWLFNLIWLFPWSAYLLGAVKLSYRTDSRAGRARLMALCWIGVVMVFFTFSTTQEYYSMPIYPALALLVGSAIASSSPALRIGTRFLIAVFAALSVTFTVLLAAVRRMPVHDDISTALTQNPAMYTLSLGHMADLTLAAFAYLKLPLAIAAVGLGSGALLLALSRNNMKRVVLVLAGVMILFFQGARIALARFDPYLGSYSLAEALNRGEPGQLIEADSYYAFSSVFFYTNHTALLLNGRNANLEYGSYAPGAPKVFIDNDTFIRLWSQPSRYYLLAYGSDRALLEQLVGRTNLYEVAKSGTNYLLTNHPVSTGSK